MQSSPTQNRRYFGIRTPHSAFENTRPGRKVRTSKNTRTNIPVAVESTKGLVAKGTYMYESLTAYFSRGSTCA